MPETKAKLELCVHELNLIGNCVAHVLATLNGDEYESKLFFDFVKSRDSKEVQRCALIVARAAREAGMKVTSNPKELL